MKVLKQPRSRNCFKRVDAAEGLKSDRSLSQRPLKRIESDFAGHTIHAELVGGAACPSVSDIREKEDTGQMHEMLSLMPTFNRLKGVPVVYVSDIQPPLYLRATETEFSILYLKRHG